MTSAVFSYFTPCSSSQQENVQGYWPEALQIKFLAFLFLFFKIFSTIRFLISISIIRENTLRTTKIDEKKWLENNPLINLKIISLSKHCEYNLTFVHNVTTFQMLQNTIVFATIINNNYSIIKLRFRFVRQLTHRQNDNNFNLFIDRSLYVEHKIIAMLGYIGDGSASRVHWQKYHSIRIPVSVFLFRFKRAYVIVSMRYEGKQETEENKKKKKGGNKRAARGNGKEVEKERERREVGDEPKSRGRRRGGSPRKEREEIWNRN